MPCVFAVASATANVMIIKILKSCVKAVALSSAHLMVSASCSAWSFQDHMVFDSAVSQGRDRRVKVTVAIFIHILPCLQLNLRLLLMI